ncbi:hypothetical protein E4U22_007977 [Claviceps purpurea]|nr:hypothetical protein E4U22_007977 [Claviceps purpurea]
MESQHAVPEYQQFMPRFLLENFSHSFRIYEESEGICKDDEAARLASLKRIGSLRRNGKKMRRGESIVNRVDMSSEFAPITKTPVGCDCGRFRISQRPGISNKEQNRIENKFIHLESEASVIFRRMLTALAENSSGLWLTREERNLVRKFMFVMKYRGPDNFKRYCHATMTTYEAEDKEHLAMYMKEHGFLRPIDVWLDNLDKLIDVKMDAEMNWIQQLPTRMYPTDAYWAITHYQSSYMSLCTSSSYDAEFLVTDNCYSIAEGPRQFLWDATSGKLTNKQWASLHEFGLISPRLVIVLRSCQFPCREDGEDAKYKAARDLWQSWEKDRFEPISHPRLADPPIFKASNNYFDLANDVFRVVPELVEKRSRGDPFFFNFFPLESGHVDCINGVFLDNASSCSSLLFHSEAALRRSLNTYVSSCSYFPNRVVSTSTPAVAVATITPAEVQRACLDKMTALLAQIGSEKRLCWEDISAMASTDEEESQCMLEALRQGLPYYLRHISGGDDASPFVQVYQMLGGSNERLPDDMDHLTRMLKFDVWSCDHDDGIRQCNREFFTEHYLTLLQRRLWLYLKLRRLPDLAYHNREQHHVNFFKSEANAPEDVVARARQVIKPDRLNQMMHWAASNSMLKARPPGFDPWARIVSSDYRGVRQLEMLQEFTFSRILKIEQFCSFVAAGIHPAPESKDYSPSLLSWFTAEQMAEMAMRLAVEPFFKSLLRGDLEEGDLDALAKVFFELLYPITPERRD